MRIGNEDIEGIVVEIPEGHLHLRTTITLRDGTELTFHEAAVANLLRAFVTVKTHPTRRKAVLKGRELGKTKKGYASWQLMEVEDEDV
jgi:hypothetical protein